MICKSRKFSVDGRDVVVSRFGGSQGEFLVKSGDVFSEILELSIHPVDFEEVCRHSITHRLVVCVNQVSRVGELKLLGSQFDELVGEGGDSCGVLFG